MILRCHLPWRTFRETNKCVSERGVHGEPSSFCVEGPQSLEQVRVYIYRYDPKLRDLRRKPWNRRSGRKLNS